MPGITPNEGENAVARIVYKAEARTAGLIMGLWAGTWNNDEARTYGQANDGALTKITASGMAEKTLTDGSWTISADNATYADQVFTNSSGGNVTVNGYYIALVIAGTTVYLHIEKDPNERTVTNGSSYTVGASNTVA